MRRAYNYVGIKKERIPRMKDQLKKLLKVKSILTIGLFVIIAVLAFNPQLLSDANTAATVFITSFSMLVGSLIQKKSNKGE